MIGDRIKMRRQELGLTQEELAKRMGYKSKSTVNKVETGKNDVNQSTAVKYTEALNTTVAYLMGWETLSDKIMETDPLGKAISRTNPNTHVGKEIIEIEIKPFKCSIFKAFTAIKNHYSLLVIYE